MRITTNHDVSLPPLLVVVLLFAHSLYMLELIELLASLSIVGTKINIQLELNVSQISYNIHL